MGTAITALDYRLKKEGRGREEARTVGTAVTRSGRGKEGGRAGGRRRPDGRVSLASEREREGAGRARAARPMGLTDRKVRRFLCFYSFLFFKPFPIRTFLFKFKPNSFKLFTKIL
jgi:hypothetical protein